MTTPVEGFPASLAGVDLERSAAWITLDERLYPLAAVYGAAYIFIDRCFVALDRPAAGSFRVVLSAKGGAASEAELRALVGEFSNELLSCAWRHQITVENRAAIEATTMRAISGAMGPPSLDDLAKFDFSAESFEDPLGIATSWEEKYKPATAQGKRAATDEKPADASDPKVNP